MKYQFDMDFRPQKASAGQFSLKQSSWLNDRMAQVGRDIIDHLVPTLLPAKDQVI